jgi:DNA-binding transcriptional ArsR family regulator
LRLKPCPALYVDWELDEEEQGRRARQLARALGDDEPPKDLYYLSALGHASLEVLHVALAECKEHGIGLVVIDSAGLAIEGDSTLSQDVIGFFDQLDRFRAEGITVLLIDHQAKTGIGESYQQKTAFGSVYKGLLSRSRLQVEATERGPGSLRVVVRQNKANFSGHTDPFKVHLTFDEDKIALDRDQLAAEEPQKTRVLNTPDRVLLALSGGPAYTEELVEPTGAVLGTVGNALTRLKRRGLVEETGERRGNAREVRLSEDGEEYVREHIEVRGASSSSSSTYEGGDDDENKAVTD